MARFDGRSFDEMRQIKITNNYLENPAGSVLIEFGKTKVICTASVEERVPGWLKGQDQGWVSAEYSMLPGSTEERSRREVNKGKQSGRTQEIQRLIGRSLRSVVDLKKMPDLTVWLDCDVIQADGGTRTASITGAFVALYEAFKKLQSEDKIKEIPIKEFLAAISVGIIDGEVMLDLPYEEDSRADVDMNLVITESGKFVEVQGTAEEVPYSRAEMNKLLDYGEKGIGELIALQKNILGVE